MSYLIKGLQQVLPKNAQAKSSRLFKRLDNAE